jgi:hypothetical protein
MRFLREAEVLRPTDPSPIASDYPVDVLCVVRLKRPGAAGRAPYAQAARLATELDSSDDEEEQEEDGDFSSDDFAFVQVYDYVMPPADLPGAPHTKFTHASVPSWDYVCLTDIYELVPVKSLLRRAVLCPNMTQQSERDKTQYGEATERLSRAPGQNYIFTHYFWLKYMF